MISIATAQSLPAVPTPQEVEQVGAEGMAIWLLVLLILALGLACYRMMVWQRQDLKDSNTKMAEVLEGNTVALTEFRVSQEANTKEITKAVSDAASRTDKLISKMQEIIRSTR